MYNIITIFINLGGSGTLLYAVKFIEIFENLINEYHSEFDIQRKKLSAVDRELQDVLHELEQAKFNIVEGYYYAKKVQELRVKRRKIKTEYVCCQRINSILFENSKIDLKQLSISLSKLRKIFDREVDTYVNSSSGNVTYKSGLLLKQSELPSKLL